MERLRATASTYITRSIESSKCMLMDMCMHIYPRARATGSMATLLHSAVPADEVSLLFCSTEPFYVLCLPGGFAHLVGTGSASLCGVFVFCSARC